MADPRVEKRPGEMLLDRYMPNASEAERAQAYENLRGLIVILVEIDRRLAREHREREIRANRSPELDSDYRPNPRPI
jgi:hypothetical protein